MTERENIIQQQKQLKIPFFNLDKRKNEKD